MSRKLIKSTLTTGGMTLVSRISGFVRDAVLARFIGTSLVADAFFVAFRIPNFLRRIFGEGAFSQAFVPVFSEYKTRGDQEATQGFIDHVAGILAAVLFIITLIGVIVAPLLVMVLAPGFVPSADKYAMTVAMLRITFPYLLFISLVAMAAGILNTHGRFSVPAFTPVLLNLSLIAAALWLAPHMDQPVMALAWGVFIAGVAQLLFQLPFLSRLRLLPRPRIALHDEGVRRVFRLMIPAIFGVSVAQINLLVDTLLASFLITGSVSWLYYSDRLLEFPMGVFAVALGTVILPSLSQKHARASMEEFSHTLDWALRWGVLVGVPATIGLIVMSGPLLVTLFQYGKFTPHDVEMAQRSLIAFSFGLPAFILIKILAPGYYARQDMKAPVRIGVIALLSNVVLNLLFVGPLAHAGLALATSCAGAINASLLFRGLRGKGVYQPLPGWGRFFLRIGIASAAMAVVLYLGAGAIESWLDARALSRVGRLAVWITAGIVVYSSVVYAAGVRPAELLLKQRQGAETD
jgi:putative peptidoglycan lipid II flippase